MPPKRPLVSDDEEDYDDLDELVSEDEDIKPGDVKQILKGSLVAAAHNTVNMRHLSGESGRPSDRTARGNNRSSGPENQHGLTYRHVSSRGGRT